MPLGQGGVADGQEYADIVAYILAQSGVPAGNEKLTPTSPMDRVLELDAVGGGRSVAASAPSAPVKIGELYGKLAQPTTTRPTQAELDAADSATDNWLMYNKGYRGERYSTLDADQRRQRRQAAAGVHVPARRARHVLDRPGGVRRHPLRDDAPRHVRDRRDDLQEAVDAPARRAGPGDERDQQGHRDRRRPRDSRHAGRLPLRARREDRRAAVGAPGRRLEHRRGHRRRADRYGTTRLRRRRPAATGASRAG